MESWETGWEVGFPASSTEELLVALVVRDLVHGSSFDVEAVEDGAELAFDFVAGDELEGDEYHLLLSAEVAGTDNRETVQAFTEQMLEDLLGEAEELVGQKQDLGSKPGGEIEFRAVSEDEERWDLVVPDWLAPDGAEVPFGFRAFESSGGGVWPANDVLDAHGRVVLVPDADGFRLFGIPAPTGWGEHGEEEAEEEGLPVHPGES